MQGVKVDSIVTFFHCADIADSGKIEDALAVEANNTSFVQLKEALVLVDDHRFDFSSVQKDDTKYTDHDGYDVLPPVPETNKK